jgi:hypothetical protein
MFETHPTGTEEHRAPDEAFEPEAPWSAGDPPGYAALISVFDALAAVQPEAGEHLVAAAHEAVLALKTLVDATEAALAEKRASMVAEHGLESLRDAMGERATAPGVRRIDLA